MSLTKPKRTDNTEADLQVFRFNFDAGAVDAGEVCFRGRSRAWALGAPQAGIVDGLVSAMVDAVNAAAAGLGYTGTAAAADLRQLVVVIEEGPGASYNVAEGAVIKIAAVDNEADGAEVVDSVDWTMSTPQRNQLRGLISPALAAINAP